MHLVHADPAQHLLQEGQREGVVVSPPAVASHGEAAWNEEERGQTEKNNVCPVSAADPEQTSEKAFLLRLNTNEF